MKPAERSPHLQEVLERLPAEPGIYQMIDAAGQIIYVGKAIDLRSRVRSYFQPGRPLETRIDAMVERVADVRTIIVRNETEALLLECNLIKQHQPPFNVRLKDDKRYPYLKVTLGEPFPRVVFTRKIVEDGGRYFGPYTDAARLRDAIDVIRRVFPLRTCKYTDIGERYHRPCLQYHIKRCMAPCAFLQTKDDYAAIVSDVVLFLAGRRKLLVDRLEAEMQTASENLAYEHAGRLRDRIADLERVMAKQEVVWSSRIDMDAIAGAHGQGVSCLEVFLVRDGKLIGQESFIVEGTEGRAPDEILSEFVGQYYARAATVAKEIMVDGRLRERSELERALSGMRGNRVRIVMPERGRRADLIKKAARNAEQHLNDFLTRTAVATERANAALEELAAALALPALPQRIEAFDISHIQGRNVVGSMVVFEDGRPRKQEYRRFKIQGGEKNDDFANMAQMLRRRLRYLRPEADGDTRGKEKKFSRRPHLLLIDGGRGQLSAVLEVLRDLDLVAVPVAALAKQFEELYLPDEAEPVVLARNSPALHLVQRLRDEAHRFAVAYHRSLRGKGQTESALDGIEGVGPARKKALIRVFGSAAAVRRASVDELAGVPGISRLLAEHISQRLREEEPEPQRNVPA
ncbi:MAG TPA: excinuclease ABC subunit UvrC [Candidatus Eremiobacteraceae bacterium]|nr:excinuclease ABC subunit UvrC [Candidatus Eremiobacteraceae bacterium]